MGQVPEAAIPSPAISYRAAGEADLLAIGGIYLRAFPESLEEMQSPHLRPKAVADVLSAVQVTSPESIIVAETVAREIVGYIVTVPDIARMARVGWRRGLPFRWLWRWLTGRYGLSVRGAVGILLDRLYLSRSKAAPECPARVLSVAVDPKWQGRGVGKGLLAAALPRLRDLGAAVVRLEVRPANVAAQRLYALFGFQVVGEVRDHRGPWLVMMADLLDRRPSNGP